MSVVAYYIGQVLAGMSVLVFVASLFLKSWPLAIVAVVMFGMAFAMASPEDKRRKAEDTARHDSLVKATMNQVRLGNGPAGWPNDYPIDRCPNCGRKTVKKIISKEDLHIPDTSGRFSKDPYWSVSATYLIRSETKCVSCPFHIVQTHREKEVIASGYGG